MKLSYRERLNAALKRILRHLPRDATPAQRIFTRQFYAGLPAGDLEHLDPVLAVRIAASAFAFMERRTPGEPKIRIFTPRVEEHGYEGRRLVIELINDDMPFLLDSLSAELTRLGFTLHETIHPIFRVVRDRKGLLQDIPEKDARAAVRESFIHFKVSGFPAGVTAEGLQASLIRVLAFVRAAVRDWQAMAARAEQMEQELARHAARARESEEDSAEAHAFLGWLRDRNFVFLGYAGSGERLGVCTVDPGIVLAHESPALLTITKSDRKSPVHRPVLMDVIGVRPPGGGKAGLSPLHQFAGLFTSTVYYQSAEAIPIVRRKIAHIMEQSGLDPVSHDGKGLKTILEFLPRDEMFQTDEDELFDVAMGLLALESRPGVRLFVRRDPFERFVSCMVFVPREYFSTQLRMMINDMLAGIFQGTVENFYTQMTDSPLARLQVVIRTTPGLIPNVDVTAIESEIARHTHLWADALYNELRARHGEARAEELLRVFGGAFPQSYVSRYDVSATAFDIEKSTEALSLAALTVDLYRVKTDPDFLHLKIYNPVEEIALSDILPVLENMGLRAIDEHPFLITPAGERPVWIRDFKLQWTDAQPLVLDHVKPLFEEALLMIWRRSMENDRFNALVLRAGLNGRQVTVLRAYAKYLRQIGFAFPQATIEQTLNAHPAIARNLAALFMARFDPKAQDHESKQIYLVSQIETQLIQVGSLTDDRILRQYMQLILATLRTNFYQQDGQRPVLSLKLHSKEVPGVPKPVPYVEIFVYGMRVEGIHLRGGKVARGGIRWSDRPEDFRTEVLGLMKAQMVKNSVIVPVGSKGGFVVKQPPAPAAGREALQAEGIACYRLYLQGLLDVTDNIAGGAIVTPEGVTRYDGDDPYLVVAADKGTASFSDIANEISRSYGFWLDDAFASGGSNGYDHKKMGITARGAWVSVTRHFREMGVDIAWQEFAVVSIGDMSGDVFGNGMLLSENIKLIAAFNHLHIFLDPLPDPKASFEERKRLFALPRSSWSDYDPKKISKGGGVFERGAKTVNISREAKATLGIDKDQMTPDELVRAILTAPVDLLWNGGIGTYVKAEDETHEQVGDRANNNVRVNGRDLRCRVVAEGGNLGFTQRGRIEYARLGNNGAGGRINTDAIDNSGGVDCSDHEVNIKIVFSEALSVGRLTREKRNLLLSKMSDEVARLVLKDNFLQTQAVSMAERQGVALLESQARLMRRLEKQGLLDRALESLPSDRQITELRASGRGLTRPELAVLLAYAKIALYREIIESSLPDESYFAADLARYFPQAMTRDFMEELNRHRLRREIIATVMTNSIVNRAGITFFFDMQEDAALAVREVAAAYTVARDAFSLRDLWTEIERQITQVDAGVHIDILLAVNRLIERVTLWGLRTLLHPVDVEGNVATLKIGVQEFRRLLPQMHSPSTRAAYDAATAALVGSGLPEALATTIASLDMLASSCDIIRVAQQTDLPLATVGTAYFSLGDSLHFGWLRQQAAELRTVTHWDRLAIRGLVQDLYGEQRRLTSAALQHAEGGGKATQSLEKWADIHADTLARFGRFIEDLQSRDAPGIPALMVALKHIRMLGM